MSSTGEVTGCPSPPEISGSADPGASVPVLAVKAWAALPPPSSARSSHWPKERARLPAALPTARALAASASPRSATSPS
eukprot:8262576-Lingulodinium_polyedra.AAC.1